MKNDIFRTAWLDPDDREAAKTMEDNIRDLFASKGSESSTHTPHDPDHFTRVEVLISKLIPRPAWRNLTGKERKLLTWAAWTHDLGMNSRLYEDPPPEHVIREQHADKSAQWVVDQQNKLCLSPVEAQVLAYFIPFHSRRNDLKNCPLTRHCDGHYVRLRLLAAYLRLADALDVDHQRVQAHEHDRFWYLTEFSGRDGHQEAIFHWVKSFVVSGITLIHQSQTIEVEFHWPVPKNPQAVSNKERFDLLARYVLDELRSELESVEDTLSEGKLSSFRLVARAPDVDFRPSSRQNWTRNMGRVLDHLRIKYSPNSTEMVLAVLEAIRDLAEAEKTNLRHLVEQLESNLQSEISRRKCHNALKPILGFIEHAREYIRHNGAESDDQARKYLKHFCDKFKPLISPDSPVAVQQSKHFWDALTHYSAPSAKSPTRRDFVLFGCSESVVTALRHKPESVDKITLWISEGRPKTRHGPHNIITYLDAERYAQMLLAAKTETGESLARFLEINILPDAAVATLLQCAKTHSKFAEKDKLDPQIHPIDGVIFGANGIYLDPDNCVAHTAGHLSAAINASFLTIPVLVIANTLKIQESADPRWRFGQRDKEGIWLSSDQELIQKLSRKHVRFWNFREDQLPLSVVSAIVSERGFILIPPNLKPEEASPILHKLRVWKNETRKDLEKLDLFPRSPKKEMKANYRTSPRM